MNIEELNEAQKKAVITTKGPILIIAGAGSGKTKVLTNKVAYLIENMNVPASEILAITFTNKAAKEMKSRTFNLIGNKANQATISTFHSFGLQIMKNYGDLVGYNKDFTILDSEDCNTIIKKIIKNMNLDSKLYNHKNIRSKISNYKNENMEPEKAIKNAYCNEEKIVVEIYKKYQTKLFTNNSIDFDDLLVLPNKILENYPEVLEIYQNKYKYILIDEYQDTNNIQYKLTKMLAKKNKNICVVGDSDQSIYSFRGADFRNILNFEKDYQDATVITLDINYRSSCEILNCANNVISNNKLRTDKKLISHMGTRDKVKYYNFDDQKEEASQIIKEIIKLNQEGISYNEMGIIYRTNSQSRVFEEEVLKYRIPYTVVGSFFFYNRKEIKDLLAYLAVMKNNSDDIHMARIINVPKRKIGEKSVANLITAASDNNTSMYDELKSPKELEFKNVINDLTSKLGTTTLTELIDYVLEKSGMKDELQKEKTLESEIRLENLEEFKSITKEYEEYNPEGNLTDFLNDLSLVSDVSEYSDNDDKLSLLTIHAAKGLEYKVVFVVGLEENVFPNIMAIKENDIEEERRLCYVALTRAKEKLYVTNAKRRLQYGEYRSNNISRFINEMNLEDENKVTVEKKTIKSIFDKNKIDLKKENYSDDTANYNIGDKVNHNEYGAGVIVAMDKMLLTIAFNNSIGIKKIMKKYKFLTKIT